MHPVTDALQRPLRDLRISVIAAATCAALLRMRARSSARFHLPATRRTSSSFGEITRVARQFVELGVRKIFPAAGHCCGTASRSWSNRLAGARDYDGHPVEGDDDHPTALLATKARALGRRPGGA